MKLLYSIFFICFLLISCKEEKITEIKKNNFDIFLENLTNKYKNLNENDLIKSEATLFLDKKIDSIADFNNFKEIPLTILSISKNPHGKGALVQFYTNNEVFNTEERISNYLNYDLICFMNENLAKKLNQNELYFINGKILKRLNNIEANLITKQTYFPQETQITFTDVSNKPIFSIGNFLCEITEIKPTGESTNNIK